MDCAATGTAGCRGAPKEHLCLENMSTDYQHAFLRTIETNFGDRGRALAQRITEEQRVSTHNILQSIIVHSSSESITVHSSSEGNTVVSSLDGRLDELALTFDEASEASQRCNIT
jgi:hypothetical protein